MARKMAVAFFDDDELTMFFRSFQYQGYHVREAPNAEELDLLLAEGPVDAIVMWGSSEAFSCLRKLRRNKIATPVFVVGAAKERRFGELDFLNSAADDYFRIPVHKELVIARVENCLRRLAGRADVALESDGWRVDTNGQYASYQGAHVHLPKSLLDLLAFLMEREGRVMTKDAFLAYHYSSTDHEPEQKIVDVFISLLRKRMRAVSGTDNQIQTVWGRGWSWVPSDRAAGWQSGYRRKELHRRKCADFRCVS